jgi:hypothetical protein
MKCTMYRWYLSFGSMELTVETSPALWSPTTSRTSLSPRSIMPRKNRPQLAESSLMPLAHSDHLTAAVRADADGDRAR